MLAIFEFAFHFKVIKSSLEDISSPFYLHSFPLLFSVAIMMLLPLFGLYLPAGYHGYYMVCCIDGLMHTQSWSNGPCLAMH